MTVREQPETFLTRAEMAKALGRSKTTIRRWEASGKLRPTVNEHGVHLFRVADAKALNGGVPVRALGQARAYVPSASRADGELAAEIFERLERGEPPVRIVTACRVHPDVVEGMVVRWVRLQTGIFLDGEQVRAILVALRIHRARDGDELVRRVQRHVEREAKCMACHARPPSRCHACHEKAIFRVLAKHGITLREDEEEDDDEGKEDGDDPNRDAREPVRDRSQLHES